jgi:hypothetical protein
VETHQNIKPFGCKEAYCHYPSYRHRYRRLYLELARRGAAIRRPQEGGLGDLLARIDAVIAALWKSVGSNGLDVDHTIREELATAQEELRRLQAREAEVYTFDFHEESPVQSVH